MQAQQLSTEAQLAGLLRALKLMGYTVIMTSSNSKVCRDIGANIYRLQAATAITGRATGCASVTLKTIIIYGTPKKLADHETVLAVLAHEVGHMLPTHTSDEVMAWNRAFSLIGPDNVTQKMRAARKQALETYDIFEKED